MRLIKNNFVVTVVGTTLVVLLLGWGMVYDTQVTLQERQFAEVQRVTSRLTLIHARQASEAFDKVDYLMREHHGGGDTRRRIELLASGSHGMDTQVRSLRTQGLSETDNALFNEHQAQETTALRFSMPNPLAEKPWIQISRRMNRTDGRFDGVEVVNVAAEFFTNYYALPDMLPDTVQILGTLDKTILARVRDKKSVPGPLRANLPLLEKIRNGATSGFGIFLSQTDGIERSYFFRTVPGYPLFVIVGISTEQVLAGSAEARAITLRFAVLLSLLLLGMAALLIRHEMRRLGYEMENSKSDDKLKNYTAQLDAIFTLSVDGYVTFDAHEHVEYVNPALVSMTGLPLVAVQGMSVTRFFEMISALCSPNRPFPTMAQLRQTRDAVGNPDNVTVEMLAPSRRIVQVSLETAHSSQVLYFRDVSRMVKLDEMKSDFLATAAHELRTPMTNVMGFAELLNTHDFDLDHRNEFHGLILVNSQRMVAILDELLDLSRIEAGGQKDIHLTRINLREVVQGLVNSFNLPEGRLPPQVVLPDLYCIGDLRKVNQIVLNIVSNAYKYSADQGGQVSISMAGPELTEKSHLAGIVIQDQGMGMTPENVALIFERFYRVDKSCTTPGTGLGMSIVKELMELLNGKVLISSALGQGTAVTLLFPAFALLPRPI